MDAPRFSSLDSSLGLTNKIAIKTMLATVTMDIPRIMVNIFVLKLSVGLIMVLSVSPAAGLPIFSFHG